MGSDGSTHRRCDTPGSRGVCHLPLAPLSPVSLLADVDRPQFVPPLDLDAKPRLKTEGGAGFSSIGAFAKEQEQRIADAKRHLKELQSKVDVEAQLNAAMADLGVPSPSK